MEEDYPFQIFSHTVPVLPFRQYSHAVLDESQDLFISVKQYVPRLSLTTQNQHADPITLIAAGGLGFIKELYEPFFAELLSRAHDAGFAIRAIWIADLFNTGQSAVTNASNLGCDPAWLDHARDLWTMINHFRKDMIRPIVGLGHSMGCNQLVYLSHWHPRLFNSLACVEAGVDPQYGKGIVFPWAYQTLQRKDKWETREEAEKDLIKAHVANSWDARAVERLKRYGIYETADSSPKEWRATTPKAQIAALVFRFNPRRLGLGDSGIQQLTPEQRDEFPDGDPEAWNPGPFYRAELKGAWDLLQHVRPWVLYINAEKSPFFGRPTTRDERAKITGTGVGGNGGMRMGAVEQVLIKDGTHTMIFERQMCEVADTLSQWLGKEVKRWQKGGKSAMEEWQRKSVVERQSVPKGFEKALRAEIMASRKPKL